MSERKDSERGGLDEIEPLDDVNRTLDRQEPDDDYYIRNYVLKESEPAQDAVEAQAPEEPVLEKAPEPEDAPEAVEVVLEEKAPPATTAVTPGPPPATGPAPIQEQEKKPEQSFGTRAFAPPKVEPAPPAVSEPAEGLDLSREESLTNALSDLLDSSPDVEAAMLVSLDGLPMASALPETMEEDRVAAMSAAILGLGERASAELGRGELKQVFVEGKEGYVFLMSAGGKAVLTALARRGVKIGLVFYDMKHAAQNIANIL